MAKKAKLAAKKKSTGLEAFTQDAERTYRGSDSRVIERHLSVLRFQLEAQEEHIAGLQASLADVRGAKAQTEARIIGLTNILNKR